MPWFRIGLLAFIVFATWWVAETYIEGREDRARDEGRAEIQVRWDKAENQRREVADKAAQESRAKERRYQEKANVAITAANQRALRDRAAADAARSELDRLRNVPIPDTKPDSGGSTEAACRAADDRTRAVRELLAACSAEYEDMARAAGGHLRDSLSAREAWPTLEAK